MAAPPPALIDIDDAQVMITTTKRKNRQTKVVEKIDVQFKLSCYHGIPQLEIKENEGNFEVAKKSDLTKYKKQVIQDILVYLFGYTNIKQNKDILERILMCSCGIETDPEIFALRILNDDNKTQIIDILKQEIMVLLFDVYEEIKNPPSELKLGNAFIEDTLDVYRCTYTFRVPQSDRIGYRFLYDHHHQSLRQFTEFLWETVTTIWINHPTDNEYITESIKFTRTYHECKEYVALSDVLEPCLAQASVYQHQNFNSFAYGLLQYVHILLKKEITKWIMNFINTLNTNQNPTGKQLNSEELFYLRQSMGGATANSRLRIYYGTQYRGFKQDMLIVICRSLLLDSADIDNAKIAFRLKIENRGHLRLLNQCGTEWVGEVMDLIKPKLFNLILMYRGQFKEILNELLDNTSLKESYRKLFDYEDLLSKFKLSVEPQDDADTEDQDIDMKDDECDTELDDDQIQTLFADCMDKTYHDFVSGVFTRSIWGYLKPLRPSPTNIAFRNALKLNFGSSKPKYSPLQTGN
eukprot:840045_1